MRVAVAKDGAPDRFLTRTLKTAELVRTAAGVAAAVAALRAGQADVYASNGMIVHNVADALPGAKVVPGRFTSVAQAVAIPKERSPAAQQRLAEIMQEANTLGLVRNAIQQAGLKGVRPAD